MTLVENIDRTLSSLHEVVNIPLPLPVLFEKMFGHECIHKLINIYRRILVHICHFEYQINCCVIRIVQPGLHEVFEVFAVDLLVVDVAHEVVEHVACRTPALLLVRVQPRDVYQVFDFYFVFVVESPPVALHETLCKFELVDEPAFVAVQHVKGCPEFLHALVAYLLLRRPLFERDNAIPGNIQCAELHMRALHALVEVVFASLQVDC